MQVNRQPVRRRSELAERPATSRCSPPRTSTSSRAAPPGDASISTTCWWRATPGSTRSSPRSSRILRQRAAVLRQAGGPPRQRHAVDPRRVGRPPGRGGHRAGRRPRGAGRRAHAARGQRPTSAWPAATEPVDAHVPAVVGRRPRSTPWPRRAPRTSGARHRRWARTATTSSSSSGHARPAPTPPRASSGAWRWPCAWPPTPCAGPSSREAPVLLLDDVFSELDAHRAAALVELLPPARSCSPPPSTPRRWCAPGRVVEVVGGHRRDAGLADRRPHRAGVGPCVTAPPRPVGGTAGPRRAGGTVRIGDALGAVASHLGARPGRRGRGRLRPLGRHRGAGRGRARAARACGRRDAGGQRRPSRLGDPDAAPRARHPGRGVARCAGPQNALERLEVRVRHSAPTGRGAELDQIALLTGVRRRGRSELLRA